MKTFVTTRMLAQGFLAVPAFYASTAHTDDLRDRYLAALADVFAELAGLDDEGLAAHLPDGVVQSGFARLT